VVFLLPLVGAHNRLVAEKERMLSDTAQRIKSAIESLHRSVDAADWGNGEQLKETLTALDIEQKMLERIPTWPWQPETLRLLLSALFIPIMLLVTQFIIQRILRP
jgi:hypothetical protein